MPTENKFTTQLPEVKRWQLKGFIPGVEGESKAVSRPIVVLADDFDRVAAERDGLQLALNTADQTIDDLQAAVSRRNLRIADLELQLKHFASCADIRAVGTAAIDAVAALNTPQ
ncbi:MAG: hypothetical protein ACRESJ_05455 [Pseudomonas sp.]|uniref:hypothetical protein n=1 Tax=Pseudomonas sp. TaxID=306 RepID=UPI003D6FA1F4